MKLIIVLMFITTFSFAQKGDTVKLPLSKLNIETLLDLNKKSTKLRGQLEPLQKQLNLVDSAWSAVLRTKLDAHGLDPNKGRWGLQGMNLIYIPIDTVKVKRK